MAFKSIASQLRGLDAAVKTGSIRALNKALATAKSKAIRELRDDTGLKTEVVKRRVRDFKADSKKMKVSVNIAVKVGVSLRHFNPKAKKVRVKHKGQGKARVHQGVTVKIGVQSRELAPGAFFLDNKAGQIVVGRKGAYEKGVYSNPTAPRLPLAQLRSNVFLDASKQRQDGVRRELQDRFDKVVSHEVEFAVAQRFKSKA